MLNISGADWEGSFLLNSPSENKRIHAPSRVRPARPERWIADALEQRVVASRGMPVSLSDLGSLRRPESTTHVTLSSVNEASAMGDETITRLRPPD